MALEMEASRMEASKSRILAFKENAFFRGLMFWGAVCIRNSRSGSTRLAAAELLERVTVMNLSRIDDWGDGSVIHDYPQSY